MHFMPIYTIYSACWSNWKASSRRFSNFMPERKMTVKSTDSSVVTTVKFIIIFNFLQLRCFYRVLCTGGGFLFTFTEFLLFFKFLDFAFIPNNAAANLNELVNLNNRKIPLAWWTWVNTNFIKIISQMIAWKVRHLRRIYHYVLVFV